MLPSLWFDKSSILGMPFHLVGALTDRHLFHADEAVLRLAAHMHLAQVSADPSKRYDFLWHVPVSVKLPTIQK